MAGAAAAVRTVGADHQLLVGYVVPLAGAAEEFDPVEARERLGKELPAALVPLLAVVDELPTRTSGKVDRAALPWPLATVDADAEALSANERWLADGWAARKQELERETSPE